MADARRRVNAHCPGCGAVEWFGNHRAIIKGPQGTLKCVDLPGVAEDEWLCNRCGRKDRPSTQLWLDLDDVAAEAGTLAAR